MIERWLRTDGGFTYDEHPPHSAGLPPLADFLQRSKLGYCQQFAGAMALMLRYLGIPSRVAVGFTSGTWKDGALDRHRPRCPRVGRGVVRRVRLARLRPDTGSRHVVGVPTRMPPTRLTRSGHSAPGGSPASGSVAPPTRPNAGVAPDPQPGVRRRAVAGGDVPFVVVLGALLALAAAKAVHPHGGDTPRPTRASVPRPRARGARRVHPRPGVSARGDGLGGRDRRSSWEGGAWAAMHSPLRSRAAATGLRPSQPEGADDARRELRRVLGILRDRLGPGRRIRGFSPCDHCAVVDGIGTIWR